LNNNTVNVYLYLYIMYEYKSIFWKKESNKNSNYIL
jgi:hypothetical protein